MEMGKRGIACCKSEQKKFGTEERIQEDLRKEGII
jgi:hypothetical protein